MSPKSSMRRLPSRLLLALAASLMLPGCTVLSLTGAVVGTAITVGGAATSAAISVTGAAVSTGVSLAGKLVEKEMDGVDGSEVVLE